MEIPRKHHGFLCYQLLPLGPLPGVVEIILELVLGRLHVRDASDVGDHVAREELEENRGIHPVALAQDDHGPRIVVPAR